MAILMLMYRSIRCCWCCSGAGDVVVDVVVDAVYGGAGDLVDGGDRPL